MIDNVPDCYGKLFPVLDEVRVNETARGVAFSACVEGWGMGAKAKQTAVDADKFMECTRCPAYRTCYDLSMAKLALSTAVHTRF